MRPAHGQQACSNRLEELRRNPFLVLGLKPTATRQELERQGAKLLALIAAGALEPCSYATPDGETVALSPEIVRQSVARLRDPGQRLVHEWWYEQLAG